MHFPDAARCSPCRLSFPFAHCETRAIRRRHNDSLKFKTKHSSRTHQPEHRYTEHEYFRTRIPSHTLLKRLMTIYTIVWLHITDSTLLFDGIHVRAFAWTCSVHPCHSKLNIEFALFGASSHLLGCLLFFLHWRHSVIAFSLIIIIIIPWIVILIVMTGPWTLTGQTHERTDDFSHGKTYCSNT